MIAQLYKLERSFILRGPLLARFDKDIFAYRVTCVIEALQKIVGRCDCSSAIRLLEYLSKLCFGVDHYHPKYGKIKGDDAA